MEEAVRIRREGGVILYPTPSRETLVGWCLASEEGITFHCFGEEREDLRKLAASLGHCIVFHPFGKGNEPERERVVERRKQNAPTRSKRRWDRWLHLPGNRYLLTGAVLLLLSMLLKRALYWRMLGSLCLLIGGIRQSLRFAIQI